MRQGQPPFDNPYPAGVAAAALVPTLVVLIAANYHGRRQATALGVLAGIPAVASAVTFVLAGFLATALSWRYSYGLIVVLAVVVFVLSFRLAPIPRQPGIRIDLFGVVLSAAAIALVLVGFNNLQAWGPLVAQAAAPFSLLRLSPAPIFILEGGRDQRGRQPPRVAGLVPDRGRDLVAGDFPGLQTAKVRAGRAVGRGHRH